MTELRCASCRRTMRPRSMWLITTLDGKVRMCARCVGKAGEDIETAVASALVREQNEGGA